MPIKIEVNREVNRPEYPFVGKSKWGVLVLFVEPATGVVISKGNSGWYDVGHWSDTWDMDSFEEVHGTITF